MILKCINSHLFAAPNKHIRGGWGICPKCGEWGYSIILDYKPLNIAPANPKPEVPDDSQFAPLTGTAGITAGMLF